MSSPRVVHCKRDPFDVYVGRPSPYGNPFAIGAAHGRTRQQAIVLYRQWLEQSEQAALVDDIKRNLRGKVLGCWCAPKRCHGDVLAEIANS